MRNVLHAIVAALFLADCTSSSSAQPSYPPQPQEGGAPQEPGQSQQGPAQPQAAGQQPSAEQGGLTDEKIDQLTAPIALYPDALLAQVLMAVTYPDQVREAATWSKEHPSANGDAAVKEVASTSWDPSVQSLVAFPQVLAMLDGKPEWAQELGQAFLAEPDAVMDSVQRLRAMAKQAGNLESTDQQTVSTEQVAPQQEAITIAPASPETVYVPSYDPGVVYGAWPYPAYPPYAFGTPYGWGYPGYALGAGIAFGVGVGVTAALWGGCRWGG
jgi:hypothetical protein